MVAMSKSIAQNDQQDDFLPIAVVVERHGRIAFRDLSAADREEAIAEAVAAAYLAFVGLKARGKDPTHFPSQMAKFAVLWTRCGRHVGGKLNSKDVMSALARRIHGFRVESLPLTTKAPHERLYGEPRGQHEIDAYEERLHDNTRSDPGDAAAFRIDFASFLAGLSERDRRMAYCLSVGNSGKQTAKQFGLTPGRVTQLRKQWQQEWQISQGEEIPLELKQAS